MFLIGFFEIPLNMALTAGPSAPEFQGFQAFSANDMVDPFTGDFSYTIPLFELPGPNGGYPFSLSYAAGVQMDDEASWVGLGWTLSSGAINRQLRGYPDEFKEDPVYNTVSMVPSVTVGVGTGLSLEALGFPVGKNSGGIGLGVSNNNLSGPGYTLSADIGLSQITKSGIMGSADISFDSNSGASVSAGLSYEGKSQQFGLRGAYHSREGLSSLGMNSSYNKTVKGTSKETGKSIEKEVSIRGPSPSISFAHPGYFPQNPFPLIHTSFTASLKLGAGAFGIFPNAVISGYYNESKFKYDNKRVATPAYGYASLHQVPTEGDYLIDLNREKDGMINSFSPNLAVPHYTYDLFNVAAIGLSGTFRAYRNEVGIIPESDVASVSIGISAGVDLGAPGHVGANIEPAFSENKSGFWRAGANRIRDFFFNSMEEDREVPPVSYSFLGDRNSFSQEAFDKSGGLDAVSLELGSQSTDPQINLAKRGYPQDNSVPLGTRYKVATKRDITPLLNEDILKNNLSLIPELNIEYLDKNNNPVSLDRDNFPGHHIAGYIITDENGLRYTFGLPVYNHVQEEYTFSTNRGDGVFTTVAAQGNAPGYRIQGTNQYYRKTEISPYAYSYLLTSIQGDNYVDLTGDGITPDDLGYWVKFTYRKITDDSERYKWRDPFIKAHFQRGYATDARDDQGYFTYGEKDIYYLAQAETKSHIARFEVDTENRSDSRGAAQRFQDAAAGNLGMALKRLKEVRLFTRAGGESNPLKKMKFTYGYDLCPGVPNSPDQLGKLTLKELAIEYGSGTQGSQIPYRFSYSEFNPSYSAYGKDRWGNYRLPVETDQSNIDWTYTDQEDRGLQDQYASAWNLTGITLPSGGSITVDYEADDYAYVQHVRASEMTRFSMDNVTQGYGDRMVYSLDPSTTVPKVKFRLNQPITGTLSATEQKEEVMKYLDLESREVYVKLDINLRKSQQDFFEQVEGYLKFDLEAPMTLISGGSGAYTHGEFQLEKLDGFHPFSVLAWKHIEIDQPYLANATKDFTPKSSNKDKISLIRGLAGIAGSITQTFLGFNNHCLVNQWGREIDVRTSGIRLLNVDGVKIGGGHRVRQLTVHDNWAHDDEGYYGQVYDYSMEENGQTISSGVSSFEPFVGGNENTLRRSKQYKELKKLKSNANLYFEYPVNESLYPSPVVGYAQVKILSLPSAKKAGYEVLGDAVFPSNPTYGTTGMTQLEFYTARDYPVIPLETAISRKNSNFMHFPNPFLNMHIRKMTASQGYGIILNDMHGKPKAEKAFAQSRTGEIGGEPISWTNYRYRSDVRVQNRKKVSFLNSLFFDNGDNSLSSSSGGPEQEETVYFGYQSDFIVDVREIADISSSAGGNFNVDAMFIFPIPSAYPYATRVENTLRTVVTNKVIYQQGILEAVESSNLGSKILSEHLRWDRLTGQPILQKLNNNFEAPIYRLDVPAYHAYAAMGAASKNTGYTFPIANFATHADKSGEFVFNAFQANPDFLRKGDELLLYQSVNTLPVPVAKAIYLGIVNGQQILHTAGEDLSEYGELQAKVYRSGNRNHLTPITRSTTALEVPEDGDEQTFSKNILIPRVQKLD